MMMSNAETEKMLDVVQELSESFNCNARYQRGLANRLLVAGSGKSLEEMTIGEFLLIQREYTDFFNSHGL